MSVAMSEPGAHSTSRAPGASTSTRGHGFGLRWQNSRKSNASDCGTIIRLAWMRPGACPAVGRSKAPVRQAWRSAPGSSWMTCMAVLVEELGAGLVTQVGLLDGLVVQQVLRRTVHDDAAGLDDVAVVRDREGLREVLFHQQ